MTRRKVCGRFENLPADERISIRSVYVSIGRGVEEWIALDVGTRAQPVVTLPRDAFLGAVHHAYHHELEEGDGA